MHQQRGNAWRGRRFCIRSGIRMTRYRDTTGRAGLCTEEGEGVIRSPDDLAAQTGTQRGTMWVGNYIPVTYICAGRAESLRPHVVTAIALTHQSCGTTRHSPTIQRASVFALTDQIGVLCLSDSPCSSSTESCMRKRGLTGSITQN
jgi:hypothetical protein